MPEMKLSRSGPTGPQSAPTSGVHPAWAWTYGVQVPCIWILSMTYTLTQVLAFMN